jgi:hypothetical protein
MADRVDRVMSYRFEHRDRPSASLVVSVVMSDGMMTLATADRLAGSRTRPRSWTLAMRERQDHLADRLYRHRAAEVASGLASADRLARHVAALAIGAAVLGALGLVALGVWVSPIGALGL